jgi:transcription elongation factor Elf1
MEEKIELTLVRHGKRYLHDKGIACPECNSLDFIITKFITAVQGTPIGEYYMECRNCNCQFQINTRNEQKEVM